MAFDSSDIGLLFKARGDTSDAIAAFDKLRDKITADIAATKAAGVSHFNELTGSTTNLQKGFKEVASEASNLTAIFTGDRLTGATSQITSFANAVGAIPGPVGLAVGAIAGITTAAVAATAALFEITKTAADLGSVIHDTAEKTGLSTETISALKVAADQSGSSIEGLSKGLTRFTLLMGEAAKGNEQAKQTLIDLHVTATDVDKAFAQVVKRIYELPPGVQQATAAGDAFGKKLGAEMIPLINQFHGDLPGLIAECERLGLTWSQADADAADKFGDQMDTLGKQMTGVKNKIGIELMPVFLDFANQASDWLSKNQGEAKAWGDAFSHALIYVKTWVEDLVLGLQILDEWSSHVMNTDRYYKLVEQEDILRKKLEAIRDGTYIYNQGGAAGQVDELTTPAPPTTATKPDPNYTDAEEQKKQKEEEDQRYKERLASLNKYYAEMIDATREAYKLQQSLLEESYKNGEISDAEYRESARKAVSAYYDFVADKINKQEQVEIKQAKNDIDRQTAHLEKTKAMAALKLTLQKEASDIDKNIAQQHEQVAEMEKKVGELETKGQKERIAVINQLLKAWEDYGATVQDVLDRVTASMEKWNELNRESAELQLANINAANENATFQAEQQRKILQNTAGHSIGKARLDALKELRDFDIAEEKRQKEAIDANLNAEENAAKARVKGKANEEEQKFLIEALYDKKRELNAKQFQARLKQILKDFQKDSGGGGLFDAWTASWDNFVNSVSSQVGTVQASLGTLAGMLEDAFNNVANALGSVIQNYVLYGATGPAVMRKVLASALASLAAEAAVWALKATALGFFYLAVGDFASATDAFISAGFWAAIAGVAAVTGRAIAGNAFNQQNQGAYGSAGSSGSTSQGSSNGGQFYSSQPDAPLDEGRNTPSKSGIFGTIVVRVESNDSHIIKVIKKNVSNNGALRTQVG